MIDTELLPYVLTFLSYFNLNVDDYKTYVYFVDDIATERIGGSYGKDNDDVIHIRIDRNKWSKLSKTQKKWVMFHELGHDVLNLDHSRVGIMRDRVPYGTIEIKKELYRLRKNGRQNNLCSY